jgi:hypothetical protein
MSGFAHRPNNDGSVDSICLRCFRTIASDKNGRSLDMMQLQHECDPADLMRFEHLESNENRQIERAQPMAIPPKKPV